MSCKNLYVRKITACRGTIPVLRVGRILGLPAGLQGPAGAAGQDGRDGKDGDVGLPLFDVLTQDSRGMDGPETINQGDDALEFISDTLELSLSEKKDGNVRLKLEVPVTIQQNVIPTEDIIFSPDTGATGVVDDGNRSTYRVETRDGKRFATLSGLINLSGVTNDGDDFLLLEFNPPEALNPDTINGGVLSGTIKNTTSGSFAMVAGSVNWQDTRQLFSLAVGAGLATGASNGQYIINYSVNYVLV